jgi:hypothetical protein
VSSEAAPAPAFPPRWVWVTVVSVLLLATGWMLFHLYTSDTARGCGRLYRAAHTAADSARVDTTVPVARSGAGLQTHSCGYLRTNARWR